MSSPISGFTAIPNPQMLAFMPIQSYLMMYFAGAGWQIGKRKVSAIPNDKFNPMSAKDLLEGFTADLKDSIPVLERSLQDITPLIKILIEQYGDFIKEAIAATPQAILNIFGGGDTTFQGSRQVIQKGPTTGAPKGTQFGALGYAQQQLMQQYILEQQKLAASQQNIRTEEQYRFERRPSTISGLTVLEAQAQAREKERLRLLELERLRVARANLSTQTRGIISSPAPQVRAGIVQRAAGQSQKLERVRLINIIAQAGKDLKNAMTQGGDTRLIQRFSRTLAEHQQQLVNLLARYRF